MLKRIAAIVLVVGFVSLAAAPEALAFNRGRRGRCTGIAGQGYYGPNGYSSPYGYSSYGYSPYVYNGVAGQRYYNSYRYRRVAGERYYRGRDRGGSTRAVMTVVAPAAISAGVGAIFAGKKGAVIGGLLGAGGGAAYHLLRNRRRY